MVFLWFFYVFLWVLMDFVDVPIDSYTDVYRSLSLFSTIFHGFLQSSEAPGMMGTALVSLAKLRSGAQGPA